MNVYVAVTVHYTKDGMVFPISFTWEDGKVYRIERVKEVSRINGSRPDEDRIMYTCLVKGRDTHLYYESGGKGRWFLKRRSV